MYLIAYVSTIPFVTFRAVYQFITKLALCPKSRPANWAENLNRKVSNGRPWCSSAPLNHCTHRLDAHLDYNAKLK